MEHAVELSKGDRERLIDYLLYGCGVMNGEWHPQSSSRLTIESTEYGGLLIRTKPWSTE